MLMLMLMVTFMEEAVSLLVLISVFDCILAKGGKKRIFLFSCLVGMGKENCAVKILTLSHFLN